MITTPDGRRWNWYKPPLARYTVTFTPRSNLTYAELLDRVAELEAQVEASKQSVVEGELQY